MSGKVISFINMKGGVGKTTLCIGMGEYLAHNFDKKILFIDLDPQFNTTQSLMNLFDLEDTYLNDFSVNNKTIKKIFESPTKITEKPKLPDKEEVIIKLDDKIDLIAGTINLIFEDGNKDGAKAKRMRKFINENNLRDNYDFIFIDCPPTISIYTDAALIASDFYLVPNRMDRYSILGIALLKQVIDRLSYEEELGIKPVGIVYTMLRRSTQKSNILKENFEQSTIVQNIGLFSSTTTHVNNLLFGFKGNISSMYKKSREDIHALCEEFIERIGSR
ncbi:MAG: AAA family ATPase [Sporomusaceae bacterium]|nr:AAA family ATPase [Sporomusaceae bacterium]